MTKTLTSFLLIIFTTSAAVAQNDSVKAITEIKRFQDELNTEFKDPKTSPLGPRRAKIFKLHPFFPINMKFRVNATLTTTPDEQFFDMSATGPQIRKYRKYGLIKFMIDEKEYQLPVYQSLDLMKKPEYENYLFLPFTDLTNGEETYAAGRYLGLRIPGSGEMIVDFNQCYNPYCAYSEQFSCPIVPKENHLDIKILAGTEYRESDGVHK